VEVQLGDREKCGLGGRKKARQKQAQAQENELECDVRIQGFEYPLLEIV
jgi:hypothetical protein